MSAYLKVLKETRDQRNKEISESTKKDDVKKAVREIFKVDVKAVQTLVCRGKMKRVGKSTGKTRNLKKAIVRLASGSDLDAFGVVMPVVDGETSEPKNG